VKEHALKMAKRLLLFGLFGLCLVGALTACDFSFGGGTGGTGKNVHIYPTAFTPTTLQVKVGTTVEWTNLDTVQHSVVSDIGLFDSEVLAQGDTYRVSFTRTGTYGYHCGLHPLVHGSIVVVP
jgi:plastocyanin